jgi:hypothetical protein
MLSIAHMARLLFNVILLFYLIMTIVNAYYRFFFPSLHAAFRTPKNAS